MNEEKSWWIPRTHPRAWSLELREKIIEGYKKNIVALAGLIAHGRGECFDYILGEKTHDFAEKAVRAAVAKFLLAKHPVFSVNGNVTALVAEEYVKLAKLVNAKLEINLFYRTKERERAIAKRLREAGAEEILGIDDEYRTTIPEISSARRFVDKRGIYIADVVFVPLEDGDRTMALRKIGKFVVTIDLNPLSRTAQWANITIVDNIVRALPKMIEFAKDMRNWDKEKLAQIVANYDNRRILSAAFDKIRRNLEEWAKKGIIIEDVLKY